jgi:hypothetical protein
MHGARVFSPNLQVNSDFELKSGHRLDTKVLGYDSLAGSVSQMLPQPC